MTLILRRNQDLNQPDYSVMWREPNGREIHAGRIYYGVVVSTDPTTR